MTARRVWWPATAVGAAAAAALATLTAYRTGAFVPVALLAAGAAATLAALRPLLAVLLAVALMSVETPVAFDLTATEVLLALAGVAWLGRCALANRWPLTGTAVDAPALLLLACVLPGLAVALDRAGVERTLVMWTLFAATGSLVALTAGPREVRALMWAIAGGAAVCALMAIGGAGQIALTGAGDTAVNRAVGSFSDPNIFAAVLAIALPAALVLAVTAAGVARAVAAGATLLIAIGLALTLSRGGMLAAAAGALVLLRLPVVRRLASIAAIGLAALVAFGAQPPAGLPQVDIVLDRVASSRSVSDSTTDQRAQLYRTTPAIIADHPLTGIGANQFALVAPRYGIVDPTTGFTFEHPHNALLTVAVELGVFGLAALVWLGVGLVSVLHRAHGPLAVAVAAGLTTVAVQGLVDYTLRSNVVAGLTAILAGCAVALSRADVPVPGSAPRRRPA